MPQCSGFEFWVRVLGSSPGFESGVRVLVDPLLVIQFRFVTKSRYVVQISRAKGQLALMQIAPVADQIRTLVLQREDF